MLQNAVCLVRHTQDRGYELGQEAESFLMSLNEEPLGVLGIVGRARTGKSYILNKMLNQTAFPVNSHLSTCTKGILLSPKVYSTSNCKYIVIDSQGIGSPDSTEDRDAKLFLLNMHLCSVLVYNSIGVIDEQALNALSLIVSLGKTLQEDIQEDSNNFPFLMWILRDFALQMEDLTGEPMSSKEYMEKALEQQKGFSAAITNKNRIRRVIKGFFKERDCETVVRPTEEEEVLHQLELNDAHLRKEFVNAVEKVKNKIHKRMRPKKANNLFITGRILVNQLKICLQSLNRDGLPRLGHVWNILHSKQQQNFFKNVQTTMDRQLQEACDVNNFDSIFNKLHQLTQTQLFSKQTTGKIQKQYQQKIQLRKRHVIQEQQREKSQYLENMKRRMAEVTLQQLNSIYNGLLKNCDKQTEIVLQNHYLQAKCQLLTKQNQKHQTQIAIIKKQNRFLAEKNHNLQKQRSTLIKTIDSQQKCIEEQRDLRKNTRMSGSFTKSSGKKIIDESMNLDESSSHSINVIEKVLEMYRKLQEKYQKVRDMLECASGIVCSSCEQCFEVSEFQNHECQKMERQSFVMNEVSQSIVNIKDQQSNKKIEVENPSFFTPYIVIPFDALTVEICKTLIKEDTQQRNYVEYTLQVSLFQSRWSLNRKYRDFCQLHDLLVIMFPRRVFPQSSDVMKSSLLTAAVGGSNSSRKIIVEERRKMLEHYLNDVLALDDIRNTRIMQKFLKVNKEYHQLEYIQKDIGVTASPFKENIKASKMTRHSYSGSGSIPTRVAQLRSKLK